MIVLLHLRKIMIKHTSVKKDPGWRHKGYCQSGLVCSTFVPSVLLYYY